MISELEGFVEDVHYEGEEKEEEERKKRGRVSEPRRGGWDFMETGGGSCVTPHAADYHGLCDSRNGHCVHGEYP